jgi:hypothetical protein
MWKNYPKIHSLFLTLAGIYDTVGSHYCLADSLSLYILYALMQYVINTLYSWEMLSSSLFLLCFVWNDLLGAHPPPPQKKEENNCYVVFKKLSSMDQP